LPFTYLNGVLCADELALDVIAERFGTPCFVYSAASIAAS
jgi:diaminopimelate decarboxylase